MSAGLAVTVGAGGLKPDGTPYPDPQGKRVVLPSDTPPARALHVLLRDAPPGPERWWSPHSFAGDYREGSNWESAAAIVLDVEHMSGRKHAPWSAEAENLALEAIVAGEFPGAIAHLTPRGMRLVFPLSESTRDNTAWKRAVDGAVALTVTSPAAAIKGLDLKIDEVSWDAARCFFTPRAIVKGNPRTAQVFLMRDRAYSLEELAAAAPPESSEPKRAVTVEGVAEIPEGERHNTLLKFAASDRAKGLNAELIFDRLQVVNDASCRPPLPDREVRDIANWSGKQDANEPLGGTPKPMVVGSKRDEAKRAPGTDEPTWEPPAPLSDLGGLPDFPAQLLPPVLSDFSRALSVETQTPPGLVGPIVLAVAGAAVARKVAVRVREGWPEPLVLWMVTALHSGGRKTAVFSRATLPLELREKELAAGVGARIAAAENEVAILKKVVEAKRAEAAKAETPDRKPLEDEAKRLSEELAAKSVPNAPRLVVSDVTAEQLGVLLAENGRRIACVSDEGATVLKVAGGLYSDKGIANLDVFLKAHAGTTIRVDRRNREPVFVPLPALTLGLFLQPKVLEGLGGNEQLRAEGFLARCTFSLPETTVGRRDPNAPTMPAEVGIRYNETILALLRMPDGEDDEHESAPHVLAVGEGALEILLGFMARLEPQRGPDGDLAAIHDWACKAEGLAVRLAGVTHLAERATDPTPWTTPIGTDTMHRAVSLVESYFLPHAVAAFGLISIDPNVDLARKALRWLRKRGLRSFKKATLHQHLRRAVKKPTDWDEPLVLLARTGWIRPAGAGAYDVNPALFAEGARI